MSDLQDARRKARMAIREDPFYSVATKASLTEAVGRTESIAALVELCAANAVYGKIAAFTPPGGTKQ